MNGKVYIPFSTMSDLTNTNIITDCYGDEGDHEKVADAVRRSMALLSP